jgi:cytochrome c-type biogenesis protein CcmH/NrfG
MEDALRKYVSQGRYQYSQVTFKNKLVSDADMRASPLDEGTADAYLGDLLYHTNRENDAEPLVAAAIKLHPDSSLAYTTLGMIKLRQQKFADARTALERAIAGDPRNHIAFFRYAYVLSHDSMDEVGYAQHFDADTAAKIRGALRKAISINPSFAESYELLAFVDLVNNEELDDAVKQLQAALKVRPGNQRYLIRLGEVLVRQSKLADAETIAKKIAESAEDDELKARAARLLNYIREKRRYDDELAAYNSGRPPASQIHRQESNKPPSKEEIAKRQAEATIRSLNETLREPAKGEQRVLGHIQRIDCRANSISYVVKAGAETFVLTSKDFDSLTLQSYKPEATNLSVGCGTNVAEHTVVITYRPGPKGPVRGEVIALEFVPDNFRFMTDEEMEDGSVLIYQQP